jgi:hypothetical protein
LPSEGYPCTPHCAPLVRSYQNFTPSGVAEEIKIVGYCSDFDAVAHFSGMIADNHKKVGDLFLYLSPFENYFVPLRREFQ